MKRAPKIFPGNVGDGGGGGGEVISTVFSENVKIFPYISLFYPKITKFFRTYQNTKTNSIINQRRLGKIWNLNDIFHGCKGHFAPGKRALL
jgi:hypothetical protein